MEPYFIYMRANLQCYMCVKEVYCHFPYDYTWNNALSSSLSYLCNHQFSSDNGLAMRRNISNVGTLRDRRAAVWAPRRSIAFRNSAGTWSRAPGKQFGVLDRWRDRHTRPAQWSDTLRIRPVRWQKWNRIRIDLARLADPIHYESIIIACHAEFILWNMKIHAVFTKSFSSSSDNMSGRFEQIIWYFEKNHQTFQFMC